MAGLSHVSGKSVSWESKIVVVNVTREQIESSPEYQPGVPVAHETEHGLYRNFGD